MCHLVTVLVIVDYNHTSQKSSGVTLSWLDSRPNHSWSTVGNTHHQYVVPPQISINIKLNQFFIQCISDIEANIMT